MDRFTYEERPAAVIAKCDCGCGETIYFGDEVIRYEDCLYIEYRCLLRGIKANWINAGEN